MIGTLATARPSTRCWGVSGDRDLMQIVRDAPPVRLLYIGRGLNKAENLGRTTSRRSSGCRGSGRCRLRGDGDAARGPLRRLPACPGSARRPRDDWWAGFGSWAELLAAVGDGDPRIGAGPRASWPRRGTTSTSSSRWWRVRTDAEVDLSRDDALPVAFADPDRLDELAVRWGLESSVGRLRKALDAAAAS
ncbi:hypothetical protein [Pseudonocardia sp. ICBG601]|uniref:hypothetical protein n=1 Tax=Pseudonocardia sp. ICBG601 TaxID=2846759 RepID=UPI0027E39249|nr:hypothetical protein [Pseudonocardia sp. ICBG601]